MDAVIFNDGCHFILHCCLLFPKIFLFCLFLSIIYIRFFFAVALEKTRRQNYNLYQKKERVAGMKSFFIMGDSISIHYRGILAQMLRDKINFTLNETEIAQAQIDLDKPMGANAGDSRTVLQKLQGYADTPIMQFDGFLLNCGLHDIKRQRLLRDCQVPLECYRQNLVSILSLIDHPAQRLFWVRTTPVEDNRHNRLSSFDRYEADVQAYNRAADEIMRSAGVKIIDLHTFTKNLGGELYCDHVHFSEPVRAMQAAFIAGHCCAFAGV